MRRLASRSLVGRATEMAVLDAAFAAAGGGQASVVLVGGEAGVGKTRLVAEMAARVRAADGLVATGGCVELTAGTAPYLAVTDALRDLSRALPERAWDRLVAGAPPELAALLPGTSAGAGAVRADDASRARLFGQVHDFVGDVVARAPLLVVLEDVHWADRSTLDLAGFLARALRTERAMLVATYRTDEVARRPALQAWLAELGRVDRVRRLELDPFDAGEVTDLLAAILGTAPDPRTAAAIAHRSGGNAFLAEELLGAAGEGDPAGLPASVRDVLHARIAALSPVAEEVVRAASAAGARVDDELLAALLPFPPDDLAAALREAVTHNLLTADARDGRLSFRHELVREAAYATLLPGERRRLHGACARVLTDRPELGADAAATAAAVAGHWHAAGEARHALAASVRAAEAAEGVHALAEAAALYERALALWDRVPDADGAAGTSRLDVLERAAQVELQVGDGSRAVALLDEALELADPAREPVRTGVLHSRRAWCSWPAGVAGPATYEHHTAALRLIPADPPSAERAHAVTDLAYTEMLNGRAEPGRATATEAVELARHVGDRRLESLALNALGTTLATLGDTNAAVDRLRDAVAIAREAGGPEEAGRAYVNLSAALEMAGRLEESVAVARDGEAVCRRFGLERLWGAFLAGNAVEALLTLGRWDEAEATLDEALSRDVSDNAQMNLMMSRARLALLRGDHAASEATLAEVRALGVAGHTSQMEAGALLVAAQLAAAEGRSEAAREDVRAGYDRAADDAQLRAGLVAVGVAAEAALAERARARGDHALAAEAAEAAGELLARLDALGPGAQLPGAAAEAATARAEHTRLGDAPEPERWRDAAAAWDALPSPQRAAYARWREAEALLAAGAGRAAATEPLRAAAAAARSLGALGLAREVERLAARARIDLQQPEPAPPAPEPSPLGLTPRELEVLAHLAAGRTNRQIAEALYISPRTAGVHVSRILAKLGAATRGEAAAAGRLAGLVEEERLEELLRG